MLGRLGEGVTGRKRSGSGDGAKADRSTAQVDARLIARPPLNDVPILEVCLERVACAVVDGGQQKREPRVPWFDRASLP